MMAYMNTNSIIYLVPLHEIKQENDTEIYKYKGFKMANNDKNILGFKYKTVKTERAKV